MDQTNMLLELYNRIITLERRVDELEKQHNSGNPSIASPAQYPPRQASSTATSQYTPKYEKDNTQYLFNGIPYGKGRLVLAVVKKYFSDNPGMNAIELTSSFNPKLQGSLGVVRVLDEAMNECSDYKRRFFTRSDEIIHTSTGDCVVCSQWGKFNIGKFISRATELGYTITTIQF